MGKLANAINKIEKIVKKHKKFFRISGFIISLFSLIVFVLTISFEIFHDSTSVPLNLIFVLSYILLIICLIPMAIINIENSFDRFLQFLLTLYSLLYASGAIALIVHFISTNDSITIYFWVSTFFILSYLYEILFKKGVTNISKYNRIYNNPLFVKFLKAWGNSAGIIAYTCNIARIVLAILDAFNKQYKFGFENWLLVEAIVTSLAFEKIIKMHIKKSSENNESESVTTSNS